LADIYRMVMVADWSVLYVIIVLFTSVLGSGLVVWTIVCLCRRWVDC